MNQPVQYLPSQNTLWRWPINLAMESSYNKCLSFDSQNKPEWSFLAAIFAILILWR
jgi:hypothetical protein